MSLRPTIAIIIQAGNADERLQMAKSWSYLNRMSGSKASIVLAEAGDVEMQVEGLFVHAGFVPGGGLADKMSFPRPVRGHYIYGVKDLKLSKRAAQLLQASGIPHEANRRMVVLEADKSLQVELIRFLGYPTKSVVLRLADVGRERIRDALRTLVMERPGERFFVQPINLARKKASFILGGPADVEACAAMIFESVSLSASCQPPRVTPLMLVQEYIPSICIDPDAVAGIAPGASGKLVNDLRVILTYQRKEREYLVGAMRSYLAREQQLTKAIIPGRPPVAATVLEDVAQLRWDAFLSCCRKEGRPLWEAERLAIRKKIMERARGIGRGLRRMGCLCDTLAVDFILSETLDRSGIPEVYFLECSAHFSGEENWNKIAAYGSYRSDHFAAAYQRAVSYQRSAARSALCGNTVFQQP